MVLRVVHDAPSAIITATSGYTEERGIPSSRAIVDAGTMLQRDAVLLEGNESLALAGTATVAVATVSRIPA